MTWLTEEQILSEARERAEKAFTIPLGMASPLWVAFGAAASVGVAWWWMTRWTKAVNLEAVMPAAPAVAAPPVEIVAEASLQPEPAPVSAPHVPVVESAEPAPAPEAKAAPAERAAPPKPVPAPPAEPDDLTRLVGIGPKLAQSLAARGVTRYEHIAAWTAKDLAKVDADLKLLGRAVRDAWVAQAKRFAAEQA